MKNLLNKIMSGVMAATMVFGILPAMPHTHTETTASAAQYDSYVDPATVWVDSNGAINDLERNAIVTQETQYCSFCDGETTKTIWRVPVYTTSGKTLTEIYGGDVTSDGHKNIGGDSVSLLEVDKPREAGGSGVYTGQHWTKSYCPKCGHFNSHETGDDVYAKDKNVFYTYSCRSFVELPPEYANTYEQLDTYETINGYTRETGHKITVNEGEYCPFCFGTKHFGETEEVEAHSGDLKVNAEIGNHRFVVSTDCDKCGYYATVTAPAWVVVEGYEGVVDGKDHTVSCNDFCDDRVSYKVYYQNSDGDYVATDPPTYDEAGTYKVNYRIDYTYNDRDGLGETMSEYGTAQVILYPATADDDDTTIIIPGDGNDDVVIDPDGDTVIIAPHSHEYKYQYTVDPTETSLGYEVWSCSCGEIQQRNFTIYDEPDVHIHDYTYQYTVEPTGDELGYEVWACSCGMTENRNYVAADTHTHNFVYQYTVAPTTTELGYEIWTCSCGQTEQRNHTATVGEDTHNFVYRFRSEPSCIAEGYDIFQCTGCGTIEKRNYTSKTSHNMQVFQTVPATCTSLGYTIYQCANCGTMTKDSYTPALSHDYTATTVREANCHEKGLTIYVCENCNDSYSEETPINSNNHTALKHGVEDPAATCEHTGRTYDVCEDCGYKVLTDVPEAIGHDWEEVVTIKPTCTEQGYTQYQCANCGDIKVEDYTEPTGHKWSETGTVVSEATCAADGLTEYTCENCGDKRYEAISMTGHNPGPEATCTEPQVCLTCGAILTLPKGHTYEPTVVEPTCTAMGYTIYKCTDCDDSYKSDYTDKVDHDYAAIVTPPTCTSMGYTTYVCKNETCTHSYVADYTDKIAHNYIGVETPPTCTEMGYTTYTCSVCGDSYVSDYTEETPHNYQKEVIEPTCTSQGYTIYRCPDCGKEFISDEKESLPHEFEGVVTEPTCTEMGYTTYTCKDCGESYIADYKDPIAHDYATKVTPPTCTELGYTTYTCTVCGDTYDSDYVEVVPHAYTTEVTEPTCTTQGYTTYTCPDCGDTKRDDYVDMLGHNYVGVVTEPTCTSQGYTTYTCSRCGDSYIGDELIPIEHSYEEVVTDPTCTEMGYTTYTCSVCGSSKVEDYTDALGHDYVAVVTEPTCTEQGYTTYTCSRCGDSYIGDEKIPAAHDYEAVVTAPTCTELGYTTYTCKVCGDSYVADEIAATGHTESDWIVDIPASYTADGSKHKECTVCGTVLETGTIPMLTESGNTDEEGEQVVGNYIVLLTDKDGKPIFDSNISISEDDVITITLDHDRILSADDKTTVTVVTSDTNEAAEGLRIVIFDTQNNAATGVTNEVGQVIFPNTESNAQDNNVVTDDENTYVVLVQDKYGRLIPNCEVTVGDNYSLNVTLPDGTAFDSDNRITVTVVNEYSEPYEGIRIIVLGEGDHIDSGYTNVNGQVTLPALNQGYTNNDGIANVNDYIVYVSNELDGAVSGALVTVDNEALVLVALPQGYAIDYDNRTTVQVTLTDGTPVEGIDVNVYDFDGNDRTETTDADGIIVVPPLNEDVVTVPTDAPEPTGTPKPMPSTPEPTREPVVTEEPEITETPEEPIETETPEETEAPTVTDVPEVTGEPTETDAPEETDAPAETEKPGTTDAPTVTNDPSETDAPSTTDTPSTDKPAVTDDPEVTDKPSTTVTPSTETPSTDAPTTDAPTTSAPATQRPVQTQDPDATQRPVVTAHPILPNGSYNVSVEDNYGPIDGSIVIIDRENGSVTVNLPDGKTFDPNNRVIVTVWDGDSNEPVVGAPVTVNTKDGQTLTDITNADGQAIVPAINTDITDINGDATVTDGEITYDVHVETEIDGPIMGAAIELVGGDIKVTLPNGVVIDHHNRTIVTVTADEAPAEGVDVAVSDKLGNARDGITNSEGKVIVPPLNEDTTPGGSDDPTVTNPPAHVEVPTSTPDPNATPAPTVDPDATQDPNATPAPTERPVYSHYDVVVADENGIIPDALIVADENGNLSVVLPDGYVVDNYDNRVTVTVTHEGTPVEGIEVTVSDNTGAQDVQNTDANGQVVVPPLYLDKTDETGNGEVENGDKNYNVNVSDESGNPIKDAMIEEKEDGSISVTLPDGTLLDPENKVVVTVTDDEDKPVPGVTVTVTDSTGSTADDITNSNGIAKAPVSNEDYTDQNGHADVVDTAEDGTRTDYNVLVEDTQGKIENAHVVVEDGKITVTLPDGKTLSTSNQTTVTVTDTDGAPVQGLPVTITDGSTTRSDDTNSAGKVTLPVKTTGGGSGGSGGSGGGGGGGGGSTVSRQDIITVTDKDGETVNVTRSTTSDGYTLTLPTGYSLDGDNYYTITVTDYNKEPKQGVEITLKDRDGAEDEGVTNIDGICIIPAVKHAAYINGYEDGSVRPDGTMTRAEAAAIFARNVAEKEDERIPSASTSVFSDVDENAWYIDYVEYLADYGVIEGYENNTFRPNGTITRAEFVAMCTRFYELYDEVDTSTSADTFSDVSSTHWARQSIIDATAMDWINGYSDGTFKPDNNITRAEAVTVVNAVLGRSADDEYISKNKTTVNPFTDLTSTSYWAYEDILEAANTHMTKYDEKGNETWIDVED